MKLPQSKTEALAALDGPTGLNAVLKLYGVGTKDQSETLPQALMVDADVLSALKYLRDFVAAEKWKYIAVSQYGWGMDHGPMKAVKNCRSSAPAGKRSKVKLYRAHPDTDMYGDGSWAYPQGFAPELIEELK